MSRRAGQELGRLPWFAPLFLRAFFLRAFFAMLTSSCWSRSDRGERGGGRVPVHPGARGPTR
ncbi:hypothetical protein JNW88_24115 [Micromonospora sp. ATA32]|nr:hypothetical protein [Micromonospora sp. ATA32]